MARKRIPSLRITNKSRYDTATIRDLLREALRRYVDEGFQPSDKMLRRGIDLTVGPFRGRGTRVSGRAYPNMRTPIGKEWDLFLGLPYTKRNGSYEPITSDWLVRDLVATFYHELDHLIGQRHDEMNDQAYRALAGWANDYLNTLPFEQDDEDEDEDPLAKQRERYEHRLEKVKEWQRKLSLAQTKLQDWKQKARYYEREYPDMAEQVQEDTGLDGVTTDA